MGNSISTTSNTQTPTNSTTLANQALNGLDDGLSIVQTSQHKVIDTLAMTGYGKEGSQ